MTTIASKFGINPVSFPKESTFIVDDRRLGIEIEQEYTDGEDARFAQNTVRLGAASPYWRCENDGSLRNIGLEFVSTILWPHHVDAALQGILPAVRQGTCSWRAGIHVHVDASDLDEVQLRYMAKVYAMLEPVIFAWEGTSRDQSRFCVPWYTCTTGVRSMFEAVSRNAQVINDAFQRFGKYTALNMIPLCNLGTVEFRHMQTVADIGKIKDYINLCLGIVNAGRNKIDAPKLLSSSGTRYFIREIFGTHADFLMNMTELETLLWRGMDTANAIALSELKPRHGPQPNPEVTDVKDLMQRIQNFKDFEGETV